MCMKLYFCVIRYRNTIQYIFQHNLYSFILFIFYIFIAHSDIGIPRVVMAAFWRTYTQLVEQATVSSLWNSYNNLWRRHSIFFTNSSYRKHCPCSGNRSFVYSVVPSPTGQWEKKAMTDLEYEVSLFTTLPPPSPTFPPFVCILQGILHNTYIGIYMRILYVHGWYIKLPMYLLFIWALYLVVLRGDYT